MRSSKTSTCVVLVAHGSKAPRFDGAMKRVAASIRRGGLSVRCAYLEINKPSIGEAIAAAAAAGAGRVQVIPYFLLSGKHTRIDIPRQVRDAGNKLAGVKVTLRPYLGFDERIADVVKDRLRG